MEAQCGGWGDAWFPGTVGGLTQEGDVVVLWDGDAPCKSTVAPYWVRRTASAVGG